MPLFREEWPLTIWPIIQKDFEEVLTQRPAKQDKATGGHYGDKVFELLKTKGEIRNITCNLAWTSPTKNTVLQNDISYASVERFALDMFTDVTATNVVAASAADGAAGAAADGESSEMRAMGLLAKRNKPWQIPNKVPRGYEIPIAVRGVGKEPDKGEFERLGLDVAVNATWLAVAWAVQEKNEDAQQQLRQLILDWPFDFFQFEGTAEEMDESIFKKIVNLPAAVERLRDFCGLEATNMMRIAAEVRGILQKGKASQVTPTSKEIHAWMTNPENIKWGLHRVPSADTVHVLLRNWDALKLCPRAMAVMDKLKQMFGRDHLFDIPTKIGVIVAKSGSDLAYVAEAILVEMMRLDKKDPWVVDALKGHNKKAGEVDIILWRKSYISQMLSDYPALLRGEGQKQRDQAALARDLLASPWQMHDKLLGPARDPTWINTLPSEAARLFFKHMLELQTGAYNPEIKGALSSMPCSKFSAEKFHETDRVKRRFFTDFQVAYDSITKKTTGAGDEAAGSKAEGVAGSAAAPDKKKEAAASRSTRVQEFRHDAEKYVTSEVEAALPSRGAGGGQDRWVAGAGTRMEAQRSRRGRSGGGRGGGLSLARVPLVFGGAAAVRPRSTPEFVAEFRWGGARAGGNSFECPLPWGCPCCPGSGPAVSGSSDSQSICPRQLQSGTFRSRLTGSGKLCPLAILPRAGLRLPAQWGRWLIQLPRGMWLLRLPWGRWLIQLPRCARCPPS